MTFRTTLLFLSALMMAAPQLRAQIKLPNPLGNTSRQAAESSAKRDTVVLVEQGSPRQSLEQYYSLARDGKWQAAGRYLVMPEGTDSTVIARQAERLKAVLDRYLWVDFNELSPRLVGDTADGLSEVMEQIGVIPRPNGLYEPVRLVRTQRADGQTFWAFAPSTVRRIDEWYGDIGENWLRELFPEPLRRTGPLRVQWWQWLALLALVPVVMLAGTVLERLIMLGLRFIVRKTTPTWDNELLTQLRSPLLLVCVALFTGPLVGHIGLNAAVEGFVASTIKALITIAFFWALIRGLDVAQRRIISTAWANQRADVLSLAPLGGRLAKIFVAFLGITAVLSLFNIPVGTLLAGVGIGGIAIALGAQKTLENVIGSLAIVGDKPFEVGDWIKVEDVEGTVEAVRLRSTRIRTFDRTVVTYPNGKLADMRLESYAARDRYRLHTTVGLSYQTGSDTVLAVARGIEAFLRQHPKIWPDMVISRVKAFGPYAIEIDVNAWFLCADMNEFRAVREAALVGILKVVEENGASPAIPTTRLVMDQPSPTI